MPGSNARALAKARSLDADVVIMDLEDAVAPGAKAEARAAVVAALEAGGYGEREVVVRVNAAGTDWFVEDMRAVAPRAPDAVLLPKVEDPAEVVHARTAADAAANAVGPALWVMVETPRGVLGVERICTADARVECLVVGTSDLAKELRVPPTPGRRGLVASLSACVLAARAAGIDALDGVELDLSDDEAFASACAEGRALGFDGKTLIHPRQIAPCNAAFGPSAGAVDSARAIIAAHQTAERAGHGVVVVEGRLVERLHVEEALRTVALAAAIDRRSAGRRAD